MEPAKLVDLAGNLGAFGFVLWLAHRLTTHTIPGLTSTFTSALDKQRQDFRETLQNQRDDFAAFHKDDHAAHEARLDAIVGAVRAPGRNDGGTQ